MTSGVDGYTATYPSNGRRKVATPQNSKLLLGEAGEALVLSRLLRLGHLASLAPRNWTSDDILIHGGQTVQVKATDKGPRPEWMLGIKIDASPLRFFALVDYTDALTPIVYVIASPTLEEVAATADRLYYEQRPNSKPFGSRTVRDGWNHDVPQYPTGWLQQYREAWGQLNSQV